jgi:hypothetical protein
MRKELIVQTKREEKYNSVTSDEWRVGSGENEDEKRENEK